MKYMNMKRFASVAMAGAIAVSMMAPAFAEDPSTVIEAAYAETEIAVTVPDSGSAIINPYGLPVDLMDSRGKNVLATISGEQITTAAPLMISNQSSVAMDVTFKGAVTAKNGITVITSGTPSTTAKEALINFDVFAINGLLDETDEEAVATAFAALDTPDVTAPLTDSATVASLASGASITLREADADGVTQAGGQAFVRLSGDVTEDPTTAWADTDTFTATIAYTFKPGTYAAKSAGTVTAAGNVTAVANSGSVEVTLAPALPSGVSVSTWTWKSSNAAGTVTVNASDSKKATVKNELSSTDATVSGVVFTVSGTGSDGLPYSATITLTMTGT